MTAGSIKWLGIVAAALLLAVVTINTTGKGPSVKPSLLLPGLKTGLNGVTTVRIEQGDRSARLQRAGDAWTVGDRANYPADTGKLREALLALADAGKLEAKTSNPDRHAQLGLEAGTDATRVSIGGDGVDASVILGNVAQQDHRYVRLENDDQGWLIDTNPAFTADAADWLRKDLLDFPSSSVSSVTIAHGAEVIRVVAGENGGFEVAGLPDGRELRYASIANGMGNALQGLQLADVKAAPGDTMAADSTARITTRDGLEITATRYGEGDDAWFEFAVQATSDEALTQAAELNGRLSGWQYRLPESKAAQLSKSWDDLLEPVAADEE